MRSNHPVRRVIAVFPFTCAAIVLTLVLLLFVYGRFILDEVLGRAAADGPGVDFPSFGPVVFLFIAVIVVGLFFDGSRISGRSADWDEVVPMSATAFERLAARHFAELGWTAQRDEPDFKLFVRHRGSRPSVASITVDPVPGGTHVRMTLSREASDGDRLMREARSSAPLAMGKPDRIPPGYGD